MTKNKRGGKRGILKVGHFLGFLMYIYRGTLGDTRAFLKEERPILLTNHIAMSCICIDSGYLD